MELKLILMNCSTLISLSLKLAIFINLFLL